MEELYSMGYADLVISIFMKITDQMHKDGRSPKSI